MMWRRAKKRWKVETSSRRFSEYWRRLSAWMGELVLTVKAPMRSDKGQTLST